jgi:hypothetical protein
MFFAIANSKKSCFNKTELNELEKELDTDGIVQFK